MHTHTHTTTRRLHNLLAFAARAVAGLASIGRGMHAGMRTGSHRMGSWEQHASLRARSLRGSMRK